jgi:hypothetical protein
MQGNSHISRCGTDLYHVRNIALKGQRYVKSRSRSEKFTLNFVSSPMTASLLERILTIPIVFHIVYHNDIENISDEQIYRQVEIINRDFRKQNPDIIKVPDVWKSLAADTRIEFKLAKKDPLGRPTNGITRTYTDIEHITLSDNPNVVEKIKFTSEGGKDAWDTRRYLNIWVCNIQGLNGYAQFPEEEEDPRTDGVVLNHYVVSDIGTAVAPDRPVRNRKGRTAVHEIGHYLNCYHIWGNEYQFQDPCSGTDNVEDTPNQARANRGMLNFPDITQSCSGSTGPNGTMFMNYMDYSDDDSRYIFTVGQVARMHATLSSFRASLLQSDVLRSPDEEAAITNARNLPERVYDGVDKIVDIVEEI